MTILIFAGFIWFTDVEFGTKDKGALVSKLFRGKWSDKLLEFVKTYFYNPSILITYEKENITDAELTENHINELKNRFKATLSNPGVRSSFLYNQSADDIYERSRIYGLLLETTGSLQSVQFVDSNGIRIHYSTSARDIISQNRNSTAYRNYSEDSLSLQYDTVSVPAGAEEKIIMDQETDRIIFSFAFYDSMNIYHGSALFTISDRALADMLIAEKRLKVNEDVSVIREPAGILLGSPVSSKQEILEKVAAIWSDGITERVIIDAEDSEVKLSLISLKTNSGLYFGRLINDYLFFIPDSMKLILLLSIFLTFFLALYFILNIKPNSVTLVRNRIKRLRDSLFEHLFINKTPQERIKWILELEQRRDEIRKELKRRLRLNPRLEKHIDGIINKSWDELLSVLKTGSAAYAQEPQTVRVKTGNAEPPASPQTKEKLDEIEELEEINDEPETIGEAEPLEEIEEAETIGEAEEISEIEEIEELEEIEEAETIGEAEEISEIEEVEELEEIEDIEELAEIEEIEDIEELAEIEEAASPAVTRTKEEALEEVEAIDDVEELEEIEEFFEETEPQPSIRSTTLSTIKWDDLKELEDIIEKAVSDDKKKPASVRGLLKLAENKKQKKIKGLLALAESKSKKSGGKKNSKGLLRLASEIEQKKSKHKGLLAAASEYEYVNEDDEGEGEEDHDLLGDIDVVSPFSSMFASLEKK